MRAIDLTHTIAPGMPVYPGTEPPVLSPGSTYARDGSARRGSPSSPTRARTWTRPRTSSPTGRRWTPCPPRSSAAARSSWTARTRPRAAASAWSGSRASVRRRTARTFCSCARLGRALGHARLLRRVPGHHRGIRRLPARHAQKGRGPGRHRHRPHRGCEPLPAPPPPLPGGLCHHREPVQPGRLRRGALLLLRPAAQVCGFGRAHRCARWRSCRRSLEKKLDRSAAGWYTLPNQKPLMRK